jgi:hypothetical protein
MADDDLVLGNLNIDLRIIAKQETQDTTTKILLCGSLPSAMARARRRISA